MESNFAAMAIYENILQTIGNTPLVKINQLTKDFPCTVLAKVETTNPGNSIKDRMALGRFIEDCLDLNNTRITRMAIWEWSANVHVYCLCPANASTINDGAAWYLTKENTPAFLSY